MSNRRKRARELGRRHGWTAPAAAIGIGGLVVWGVGAAEAATGGSFVLGASNSENKTAILTNTKGTPLSLKAKSGYPPLAVNTSKQVPHLNASLIGGLSAKQLQRRVSHSCGAGIAGLTASGGVSCAHQQLLFKSSGSFTVPAGVSQITGELWGGGGGGAGFYGGNGEGGGQGAYLKVVIPVTAGEQFGVVVGAAGSGTAFGKDGSASEITHASSVWAEAGGGHGGAYKCLGGAGGTPLVGVPSSGATAITGNVGQHGACPAPGGVPGFPGTGGYGSSDYYHYYGTDGTPGVVLISFTG